MNDERPDEDPYRFDLFLSYRSETVARDWVEDVFLPIVTRNFMGEAGRTLRVHHYALAMTQGGEWPVELKDNLARSRCLLPLWCAGYFHSEWCLFEHRTMRRREDLIGYRRTGRAEGLILPMVVSDGQCLPQQVGTIHHLDIRSFVYTSAQAFSRSAKYIEFEDAIRRWIPNAIQAIQTAPVWQSDWLTAEPLCEFEPPPLKPWNPGI